MRRQRIKVAANVNVARRSSSKVNDETIKNNEKSEVNSENIVKDPQPVESLESLVSTESEPINVSVKDDCAIESTENTAKIAENACKSCPELPEDAKVSHPLPKLDDNTFKTPMKLPRIEPDIATTSSIPNKFRKSKLIPRLDSSRTATKSQVKNLRFEIIFRDLLH